VRILIIGGTGMTGPFLVRGLLAQGHEVHLLHRQESASPLLAGAHQWLADRDQLPALRPRIAELGPEVVVHMVAFQERHAADLLAAASGIASRIVIISSCDVYRAYGCLHRAEAGPIERGPLAETAPLRTRFELHGGGYEKIAVERVAACDPRLPCTILRYPAVYGPGDAQHRLRAWVRRMDDGRPAVLLGAAQAGFRFAIGYVENVAAAAASAITHPAASGRVYNCGDPQTPTAGDWLASVAAAIGWRGRILLAPEAALPTHLATPYDYQHHLVVDTTRLRDELGFTEPVAPAERLARTIAWERAHPSPAEQMSAEYAAEDALLSERSAWQRSSP
jgi:nucleoside-diphosphate-sugar epimerase